MKISKTNIMISAGFFLLLLFICLFWGGTAISFTQVAVIPSLYLCHEYLCFSMIEAKMTVNLNWKIAKCLEVLGLNTSIFMPEFYLVSLKKSKMEIVVPF